MCAKQNYFFTTPDTQSYLGHLILFIKVSGL